MDNRSTENEITKIKVLVADDIAETRKLIIRLLGMSERFEVVGEVENGQEVIDFMHTGSTDIVLMDINMPILNGLEATRLLGVEHPEVLVVIMSVQSENEYLKKAMHYGAKEYIIKPFNFEILTQTLEDTYKEYHGRVVPVQTIDSPQSIEGAILSVFSTKGGVGKTFIASQLAMLLAQKHKKRVLMIDGDLQFGDLGLVLGVKNQPNLSELYDQKRELSYDLIKLHLINYCDGLELLLAPARPEQAEGIPKEFVEAVLMICKKHFDIIICDLGVNYNETTLMLLDQSLMIYLITQPSVSAIHHTKLGLEVMQTLNYSSSKVKLILNQTYKGSGISQKEIETVLGQSIAFELPEDIQSVRESVNQGQPMAIHKRFNPSKLSKQLNLLATYTLAQKE